MRKMEFIRSDPRRPGGGASSSEKIDAVGKAVHQELIYPVEPTAVVTVLTSSCCASLRSFIAFSLVVSMPCASASLASRSAAAV